MKNEKLIYRLAYKYKMAVFSTSSMVRMFLICFLLSWTVELIRLLADDHADHVSLLHQMPVNCMDHKTEPPSVWTTLAMPFSWTYTTLFEAPIKRDCLDYFRRINRVKLYLPRIPQSFANVVSQLILAPFELFLDKFGDALRRFMDKFNVAERLMGVLFLMATLLAMTMIVTCVIWKCAVTPTPTPPPTEIRYLRSKSEPKQLTTDHHNITKI